MSHVKNATTNKARAPRSFRPRRPATIWGWLAWLLVAVLFYLVISYGVLPWWQKPIPADVPPAPPNANSRKS